MISGKERKIDPQFPWRKGWRPPRASCPKCRSNTVVYTAQREKHGNHVYHCYSCGADFASFTMYAYCEHYERLLEKDEFYTPCIDQGTKCQAFSPVGPHNPLRCDQFTRVQEGVMDAKDVRRIENSMRVFRKPKHQVRAGGGMGADALDEARKERLRRLTEEG